MNPGHMPIPEPFRLERLFAFPAWKMLILLHRHLSPTLATGLPMTNQASFLVVGQAAVVAGKRFLLWQRFQQQRRLWTIFLYRLLLRFLPLCSLFLCWLSFLFPFLCF